MDNIKPFLGIILALLAIISVAYTLSSKLKSKINKASHISPKKSITNDQRILDIIVAIADVYKAAEKDK